MRPEEIAKAQDWELRERFAELRYECAEIDGVTAPNVVELERIEKELDIREGRGTKPKTASPFANLIQASDALIEWLGKHSAHDPISKDAPLAKFMTALEEARKDMD